MMEKIKIGKVNVDENPATLVNMAHVVSPTMIKMEPLLIN